MKYTRLFGSKFPEEILEERTFKDVDSQVLNITSRIKTAMLNGDFELAKRLLDENKELLSDYIISAEYINLLDEETRNLEIYAKGTLQSTFYQKDVPLSASQDTIWIGE